MKKIIAIVVLVLILALALFVFVSGWTYSDGSRAGYLIKISKKGVLFKTYEGELNLGGLSDGETTAIINQNIWKFSSLDEDVYKELQKYEGQRISVNYRQVYRNFPWQGETDYFVTGVELLE